MAAAISAPGARRLGRVGREWETRQRDETPGQDRATIQPLGRQATAFTEKLPPDTAVSVEQDVEPRDRYGRLLAYL
jgi:endonuclease YncB( thermonuclease family)